jgi:hypothetical protein
VQHCQARLDLCLCARAKVRRATSGRRTPRRAADGRTGGHPGEQRTGGALCHGWACMLTPWGKGGHGGSPNVEAGKMHQHGGQAGAVLRMGTRTHAMGGREDKEGAPTWRQGRCMCQHRHSPPPWALGPLNFFLSPIPTWLKEKPVKSHWGPLPHPTALLPTPQGSWVAELKKSTFRCPNNTPVAGSVHLEQTTF